MFFDQWYPQVTFTPPTQTPTVGANNKLLPRRSCSWPLSTGPLLIPPAVPLWLNTSRPGDVTLENWPKKVNKCEQQTVATEKDADADWPFQGKRTIYENHPRILAMIGSCFIMAWCAVVRPFFIHQIFHVRRLRSNDQRTLTPQLD